MSRPAKNQRKDDDRSGLREGEIAVALPAKFDASLYFIGRIRTPWQTRDECPKNGRETEAVCTIELDPRWAAGLQGLETVSHIWCCIGWTRPGAIWFCNRRVITPSIAAHSRCARRCGPIPLQQP